MKPESYKLFAQLCEGYLDEASTSLDLITGSPGGKEVIVALHKDMNLAHDQDYRSVEKISWSELKDAYQGAWVIIIGSKGTGAIKSKSGNYDAVASAGGPIDTTSDGRGGNILDFLKSKIGKLQKFYVGKNSSTVADKKRKRADSQKGLSKTVDHNVLVKKFKPLWVRAINSAIADVKGHIANQIKNDAFEKAKKKLHHVERLQNGLESLEAGSTDTPSFINGAVQMAIYMAASHYYPEQTGNITKGYSDNYSTQFPEGPQQLLKDISAGDTKKMGTVLGFFKRNLISG